MPLEALTMSINVSNPMGIAKYPSLATPARDGFCPFLPKQNSLGWNIVAVPQLGQELVLVLGWSSSSQLCPDIWKASNPKSSQKSRQRALAAAAVMGLAEKSSFFSPFHHGL